jgi:tetratricopeptide (TPR) repeat protein
LKEGRAALARDDAAAARGHLARCLEAWPQSSEAHFLAARAARRCEDLEAARGHLAAAERFGRAPADVEAERLLLRAQSGEFAEVGPTLLRLVNEGHPQSAEILSFLVPMYVADFRIADAGTLTARWVEAAPDSVRAWTYRADALERLRRKDETGAALRRLLELAPDDRRARASLVRVLLEIRQNIDEAAGHAEWLTATDPADTTAQVQLAACRQEQGRGDEAAAILDRVIAATGDAQALHHRGRLEMNRGRPTAALPFLRRAADRAPDTDVLYSLFLCTKQVGTPEEARAAEERWRQFESDWKRIKELGKAISAAPQNPDLRREMGELFLRYGKDVEGVRWLDSALRINPDHEATHKALAAYYERTGRPDLARPHRDRSPP